jgi:predicted N-acetyltransferase YhbS
LIELTSTCDPNESHELFYRAFSDTEGANEGLMIAELAGDLAKLLTDNSVSFFGFRGTNQCLVAGVFVSSLSNCNDIKARLLAPVATHPNFQGKGLARQLIEHTVNTLSNHTDLLVTYGDPNFYQRFGFTWLSVDIVKPPYPLQYSEGWLAINVTEKTDSELTAQYGCIEPFRNPHFW